MSGAAANGGRSPLLWWGVRPRRTLALVAVGTGLLAGACGAPPPPVAAGDDRPVVLATFTVLADLAAVVAGEDATVLSLVDVGAEIHGHQPSPDDLRRAAAADLVLANGLGLEVWLTDLVGPLDLPTVVLSDGVDPLPVGTVEAAGASGTGHGSGAPVNPHAWMSPREAVGYVERIAAALADLDPAHADDYAARAEVYADEITQVGEDLLRRLETVPPAARVLVTCEGAFSYLARDAGLEEAYLWPVNAERQGTPRQVAAVVDRVREADVPAVFCESTVADRAQRQVARETGATFAGVLYVDSLSGPDGPVPTYLDLLRHDADVIAAGLGAA